MLALPEYPKILLHSDNELKESLGARLVSRKTIHEWPLFDRWAAESIGKILELERI